MDSKSINAAHFGAVFSANGRISEPVVDEYNARKRAEWEADREAARKASSKPAETSEQANRRKVAVELSNVLRGCMIGANTARIGGLGAVTAEQQLAQDNFRAAVASKANCRSGYVPSDATWELACTMLEVI